MSLFRSLEELLPSLKTLQRADYHRTHFAIQLNPGETVSGGDEVSLFVTPHVNPLQRGSRLLMDWSGHLHSGKTLPSAVLQM